MPLNKTTGSVEWLPTGRAVATANTRLPQLKRRLRRQVASRATGSGAWAGYGMRRLGSRASTGSHLRDRVVTSFCRASVCAMCM